MEEATKMEREKMPPTTSTAHRGRLLTILATLVLLIVAISALTRLSSLKSGLGAVGQNPAPEPTLTYEIQAHSFGPPVDLATVYAVVKHAVARIDEDALLYSFDATSPGFSSALPYAGPEMGSLRLRFYFYRPSGSMLMAEAEDAAPASTVRVETLDPMGAEARDTGKFNYQAAQNKQVTLQAIIADFRLGPRDAVATTWAISRRYSPLEVSSTKHLLPLVYADTYKGNKHEAQWIVQYWLQDEQRPQGAIGIFGSDPGAGLVAEYKVNADNGSVTTVDPIPK